MLIHARPEYMADAGLAVSMLPKACVTYQTEVGRAVVVLEAATAGEVKRQIDSIRSLRGLLNEAPVYQYAESESEVDREMDA